MLLLADMNLTPRWVSHLITGGHEAVHWSSIGPLSAKDGEITEYARRYGFTLLTNDLDFPQILAHTKEAAPSIVLLRGEPLVPEVRGTALLNAIQDCADDLARGGSAHSRLEGSTARTTVAAEIGKATQLEARGRPPQARPGLPWVTRITRASNSEDTY